jgi:hypothetical protein
MTGIEMHQSALGYFLDIEEPTFLQSKLVDDIDHRLNEAKRRERMAHLENLKVIFI